MTPLVRWRKTNPGTDVMKKLEIKTERQTRIGIELHSAWLIAAYSAEADIGDAQAAIKPETR
jgi:hypothetical protein